LCFLRTRIRKAVSGLDDTGHSFLSVSIAVGEDYTALAKVNIYIYNYYSFNFLSFSHYIILKIKIFKLNLNIINFIYSI
jgi:hypothetical protein